MNLLGWSCCEVWMLLLGMMVGVGYVIWVGRAARLNCRIWVDLAGPER